MEPNTIWKAVLTELELSVSKATYQTHFAHSELLSLKDGVATVGLNNPLVRTMVETRYYSLVKSVLDHHVNANISIIFVVTTKKRALSDKEAGPLFSQSTMESPRPDSVSAARRLHIRPEFTFETFAVSTTNQIAYAAASAVAKSPGSAYNPLFFYGGVGVGKTHLMHAVANALLSKKPASRIVYCAGEEFLNDIIEAIQTKSVRLFKQRYRSAELLLVDDVQFIAGKQTAQEEFFHTFNAVLREGGQVILTSDRSPAEISRLEDRLRSRFEGGLMVDISPPDFELRAAIVNIKSRAIGLELSIDASRVIAANLTDTRAIEGFLKRLTTEVSTHNTELTPDAITTLLSARGSSPSSAVPSSKRRVSPQEIVDAVSAYYDIKPTALKGIKRDRPIARPRQLVMYLCKVELGLTLNDIGGLLGGRDHTTIMHGVDTITHELPTNERLREAVMGIKKQLWV
jgi:chromosomal replication initiator protein